MTDRIITALDVTTVEEAETLIALLGPHGTFYKIGYQLFPLGGYGLARRLADRDKKVFIDAKLLDIGSTVERGVRSLRELNAHFLTVHADHDAVAGAVEGRGDCGLKILGVTVLTSWDEETLARHGLRGSVEDLVLRRAEIALGAGADGLVASAREAPLLRKTFGEKPLIVTPGIRPAGVSADDQKRVVTPRAAVEAGADHLVVGRAVTKAPDPAGALRSLLAELGDAA